MDQDKNRALFHMIAGAVISGKSFLDYAEEIATDVPTKTSAGKTIKENKTFVLCSNLAKANIKTFLSQANGILASSNPAVTKALQEEVDRVESIVSKTLLLTEQGQKRVIGLINQLYQEGTHIYDTNQTEA